MKYFLMAVLFSFNAMACDWSTIKRSGDEFVYSSQCHLSVGRLVKTENLRQEQVKQLNKSLTLKDLAIGKASERADYWEQEAHKQNKMLQDSQKSAKMTKIAYFGLGVVSVMIGAWAINQVK